MEEIWKDIPGYEGKYQASTFGRIKSLQKVVNCRGGVRVVRERILKQSCKYKDGKRRYKTIDLGKDNNFTVHRLIALTFIPNTKNLPQINHIDGDKWNNSVDNLEWCTQRENMLHAYKIGLQKAKLPPRRHLRKITSISREGERIEWPSHAECARGIGMTVRQIQRVVKGKRSHCHGYSFVDGELYIA